MNALLLVRAMGRANPDLPGRESERAQERHLEEANEMLVEEV